MLERKENMSKLSQLRVGFYRTILTAGKISRKEEMQAGTCWILHDIKSSICSEHRVMYLWPGKKKCFENLLNKAYRKIGFKKNHFSHKQASNLHCFSSFIRTLPNCGRFKGTFLTRGITFLSSQYQTIHATSWAFALSLADTTNYLVIEIITYQ